FHCSTPFACRPLCSLLHVLLLISLRIPRSPTSTLFPYTTLFRSILELAASIPRLGRLPEPAATATAHSKLCGSTVTVDLAMQGRSEEHTSELQSREKLVCRLLLEKKKRTITNRPILKDVDVCTML